jgi:oligosaccharide translocation protein RFT1
LQVAWLTIPVVSIFSGSTLLLHLLFSDGDTNAAADYRIAGILYCLASWIEGCGEPAVLFFLRKLEVPPRVEAEGIASVVKTMATAVGIQVLSSSPSSSSSWSLTVFGLAQLMYSIAYTSYLYARAWSRPDWKGRSLPPGSVLVFLAGLDKNACYTTLVYTIQGFFKHALTEADKIILTAMADSYDKGVYAMGASYGGMAARILLQPLEENARLLWSRQAASSKNQPQQEELLRSYTTLVKLVLYVGLVFGCVAVHYTNLLLNLLAGRTWGSNIEAANVLAAFCVYTAFLALNGMTEAFVYAVASGDTAASEMTKLGLVHTVTGFTFAVVASVLVTRYGTLGLVAANCVAMFTRSLYSLHFAKRYFSKTRSQQQNHKQETPLLFSAICPHPLVLFCFAFAWLTTRWSLQNLILRSFHLQLDLRNTDWLLQTGQHVAIGFVFVVGIAVLAVLFDRSFIQSLEDMVRHRGRQRDSKSQEQRRPKQD